MKATSINRLTGGILRLAMLLPLTLSAATQTPIHETESALSFNTGKVSVATAVWPDYAEKDSKGGYFLELLLLAFPTPQYQFDINYVPYQRSKQLLNNRQVDIAVSMIKGAPTYTSEHSIYLGAVYHVALSKQLEQQWQGVDSLIGKRVGIPRGYNGLKKLPPRSPPAIIKTAVIC